MRNNLLKSLLILCITILLNSFSAKADIFWTEGDGDWDDPNIWNSLFSGSNVVPGNSDNITIRNIVRLTGNRTLAAGGKITVGGVLWSAVLTVDNVTNFGEILIYGNGKLFFNRINNNASAEIDNYGKLIGSEILNAAAGKIHNRPSGTLLLSDGLVNGGSFENKVNAVFNAQSISNISGDITNDGLIRCDFVVNDMGGDITNSKRMEIAVIHNGVDETGSTNGGGSITNTAGSTIIISDHMDNYSGRFNNHGLITVENYWHNYDRFRVGVTGTLLVKTNATNFASGSSGVGILKLFGIIRMGKFAVLHLDAIPPKSWDKYFVNKGSIEGNGQGGIYAKEENTFVTNDGDITIGAQEVFLCIGTPADYINNGTGDFTQDCCFLLTADAGPDQTFCWNVPPYAPIGGSPTASMGIRPYNYNWNPNSFLTNAAGANGGANPPAEQIYTINITDDNGCTASDQVTITPETTDPIAFAGDNITSCPGEAVVLGASPAGTCGTGVLNYQWSRVVTTTIFVDISNDENPTVSPTSTTTYRLIVTDGNATTAEDYITVYVNSDVVAYAGADDTACGSNYTMGANIGSAQTGTWTTVGAVPPLLTIPDVNNPNTTITGLPNGVNVTLKWTVTKNTCTATDQVTITGGNVTQATVTNTDVTVCVAGYPHTEILDGNLTSLGETGQWNILSANAAEISIANPAAPFSAIEFTKDGVYQLKWTITDGSCTSESALKTITVKQKTILTSGMVATCSSIGANPNVPVSSSSFLGGAAGIWSYDIPTSGAADSFGFGSATNIGNNTFVISNITTFPIEIMAIWSVDKDGCTHEYRVPIRISEQPVVTVANPNEFLCSSLNAALVHTLDGNQPLAGENGTWSVVSGSATITPGDENKYNATLNINTSILPAVVELRWAISNGSCNKITTKKITVNQSYGEISGGFTTCKSLGDDIIISLDAVGFMGGAAGTWTAPVLQEGGAGNIAVTNLANPTSNLTVTNITSFPLKIGLFWKVIQGGCISTRTVPIAIYELPVANAGSDDTAVGATYDMQADLLGVNETGLWTVVSQNEVAITFSDLTDPHMQIGDLTPTSIVKLNWTVTNSVTSCSTTSADITITGGGGCGGLTTASVGVSSTTNCNQNFPYTNLLDGNAPDTGETGKWVVEASSTATATFTDDTNPTTLMNVITAGVLDLTWTISDGGSCSSSATKTINAVQTFIITNPQVTNCSSVGGSFSQTAEASLLHNGDPGAWSATINNGAAIVSFSSPVNTASNGIIVSNITVFPLEIDMTWTVDELGCTSTYTTPIRIDELPVVNPGNDITICSDTYTMDATLNAGETGIWTQTGGTAVTMGINTKSNMIISNLTAGEVITMNWTVTNTATSCVNNKKVDITTGAIVAPVVGPALGECVNLNDTPIITLTDAAVLNIGETGKWTFVPSSGTADSFDFSDDSIPGSEFKAYNITVLPYKGILTWTVSKLGVCDKIFTQQVTINKNPTADAGTDQEINCANSTVTIGTGTAQAGFSYEWTTTTGNITGATNTITTTADQAGTYTLKITNTTTTCFATDDVVVTSTSSPPVANEGSNITLCDALTTTLNATMPITSTGLWEVVGGTAVIVSSTDPKTGVTGLNPNAIVTLKWTEDNSCGTDSKTITITTSNSPTLSDAGPDQTLCDGTTMATLEGNIPTSGTGVWTVVSGSAILSDEFFTNSSISGLTDGSVSVLKWTITNGICPISESEVTIKVLEPKAVENSEYQICDGDNVQLIARGGISYAWSPPEGLSAVDIPNPIATPNITTTYTVEINGGGSCGNTTREIKVNVIANPIVTITEDATINIGESIDLLATGGTGYSWTPADGLDNASIANPVATPTKNTTYNVTVSNIEGCNTEASVTIDVKEDFQIFVPQMFEPNNSTNNVVKVNTIGIKNVVFKIYNRTNKEVFSTTDVSIGWDGKYNGTVQNMDTYIYVVIAETYAGTKITRQGSIQLVR